MTELITDKELAEYVDKHQEEIKQLINAKAEKVIKQELRNAFTTEDPYYGREEGYARKTIREATSKRIRAFIDQTEFPIDEEALHDKLNRSINSQLKRVKAHVEIDLQGGCS